MDGRAEFILDNSVVTSWWFESQANAYADAIQEVAPSCTIHAPALWPIEFANQLRRAKLERRLTIAQVHAVTESIGALAIQIDATPLDPMLLVEAALRYGLTACGAAYLVLALRLGLPIATTDAALSKAARATGVGVFKP